MIAGQTAGDVDAVDRDLPRVELGDFVDGPLGERAIGEEEHGVGPQRQRLFQGGSGVGSPVRFDQAKPGEQEVLRLQVGAFGAWGRPASGSIRCCRR